LGKRQFPHDLTTDSRFLVGQQPQNANAGRVADGFRQHGEFFVSLGALDGP
jgi:hypothetical protein